jgi:ornithine cyclodeaminase/alanine dehydrogenase-like protein (mu-crystallin family)
LPNRAAGRQDRSVFRGNVARGLPTVTSIYVLSDYATGAPLAIMDGSYLTALRTAAGSAVSTRALARTDARILGVFGTGVPARFQGCAPSSPGNARSTASCRSSDSPRNTRLNAPGSASAS